MLLGPAAHPTCGLGTGLFIPSSIFPEVSVSPTDPPGGSDLHLVQNEAVCVCGGALGWGGDQSPAACPTRCPTRCPPGVPGVLAGWEEHVLPLGVGEGEARGRGEPWIC